MTDIRPAFGYAMLGVCKNFIMKKVWRIVISQNGWEYSGWVNITAVEVKQISDTKIIADGIEMEFDEEIRIE